MLYYCYSETCHVHHECECGTKCCMGFYYSPAAYTIEDEDLTEKQKIEMVFHHMCPICTGWVEC